MIDAALLDAMDDATAPAAQTATVAATWREHLPGGRLLLLRVVLIIAFVALLADSLVPEWRFENRYRGKGPEYGHFVFGWPLYRYPAESTELMFTVPTATLDAFFAFAVWCGVAACGICLLSTRDFGRCRWLCGGVLLFHVAVLIGAPRSSATVVLNSDAYLRGHVLGLALWPPILFAVLAAARGTSVRSQISLRGLLLLTLYMGVLLTLNRVTQACGDVMYWEGLRVTGQFSGPVAAAVPAAVAVWLLCRAANMRSVATAATCAVLAEAVVASYFFGYEHGPHDDFHQQHVALAMAQYSLSQQLIAAVGAVIAGALLTPEWLRNGRTSFERIATGAAARQVATSNP